MLDESVNNYQFRISKLQRKLVISSARYFPLFLRTIIPGLITRDHMCSTYLFSVSFCGGVYLVAVVTNFVHIEVSTGEGRSDIKVI